MARKTRRKSAAKARKKPAAVTRKKRKAAAKTKTAARRKATRKAKPKGVFAEITGGFAAVIDTLSDAERLHRRLEPQPSLDREPE